MLDNDLLKRAEENNVQAVFRVAMAYFTGEEVEEDNDKAFSLFCRVIALDPSFSDVYSRIGKCFENGWGTQQDFGKAIEMFSKGAQLNSSACHYYLALAYEEGKGVPQDGQLAIHHHRIAAELGDSDSMLALFHYHVDKKEYSNAAVWADRAAQAESAEGNRMAQAIHSILACAGEGIGAYEDALSDWVSVKKWAEIALHDFPAESGEYAEAQHNLNTAIYGISFAHYALNQYSEAIASNTLQGTAAAILRALCIDNIATEQASQKSYDFSVTAYRILTSLENDVAYFNAEKREPEERIFVLAVYRLAGFYTLGLAGELKPDLERAVSLLYRAEQVVRNEKLRNFLTSSRQRYKKKVFGGYKYE